MGELDGRIAVITGAGRGIGREHALLFAREGAKVVVNDLGGSTDGNGADPGPAHEVVREIEAFGGQAIANGDDISSFDGAEKLIASAVDGFGGLDILVNNAGILRDRTIANMSEPEWDDVVRVHLKGHFAPLRFAAEYWKAQSKAGAPVNAAVVNTTSASGLFNNPGQSNYAAAKAGIAALSIIAQKELERYGVRVNVIAPTAFTRLLATVRPDGKVSTDEWDPADPANVSPFVAYLCTADCPIKGRVFMVRGSEVRLVQPYTVVDTIEGEGRWSVAGLREHAAHFADFPFASNPTGNAPKTPA